MDELNKQTRQLLTQRTQEFEELKVKYENDITSLQNELEVERESHEFTKLQLEDELQNVKLGIETLRDIQNEGIPLFTITMYQIIGSFEFARARNVTRKTTREYT